MTRELRVVAEGPEVLPALRAALEGGPAILVRENAGAAAPGGEAGDDPHPVPNHVDDAVALVVETSGSTGTPKRVALSAEALLASARAGQPLLGGPARWILALPARYIAGVNVMVRSLVAGVEPVEVASGPFRAEGFLDAARRAGDGPRGIALVPRQLEVLLDDARARDELADFAAVLVGGQATPPALVTRAREAGVPLVLSYGSSETSGGCVYDGRAIDGVGVRLAPDGEVQIAGPTLAEGYLGDPALTAERFVVDDGRRWFRTADGGELDDGVLRVLGRLDDVLVSGGVKVAPAAVEAALHELPGWSGAVIVAADDARWGQVPVAVIAGQEPADPETARQYVAERLGPAARPAHVIALPELPLLASGKPDRRRIAELVAARIPR